MMDVPDSEDFDEAFRARLAGIADVLVPAYQQMPAASSVGIAGDLLDKALRARPDLAADCRRAVTACADRTEPRGARAARRWRIPTASAHSWCWCSAATT